MIGSSLPTTPFRCSKIILECYRWRDLAWRASRRPQPAAGAILYYVRSTQRGTLDHVDRIGFYERQNCLVLDAVTVRNLELIEPLFAGTDAGITVFRALDATVTPMGKRLLRAWLLRPSIRLSGNQCPPRCGGSPGERDDRARRIATRAGWNSRSRTLAQPGHA